MNGGKNLPVSYQMLQQMLQGIQDPKKFGELNYLLSLLPRREEAPPRNVIQPMQRPILQQAIEGRRLQPNRLQQSLQNPRRIQ